MKQHQAAVPIPNWSSLPYPRAPSYLNSRLLGNVTIGYIEPSSHYLGNWSARVNNSET